jgi:hypothetical protein
VHGERCLGQCAAVVTLGLPILAIGVLRPPVDEDVLLSLLWWVFAAPCACVMALGWTTKLTPGGAFRVEAATIERQLADDPSDPGPPERSDCHVPVPGRHGHWDVVVQTCEPAGVGGLAVSYLGVRLPWHHVTAVAVERTRPAVRVALGRPDDLLGRLGAPVGGHTDLPVVEHLPQLPVPPSGRGRQCQHGIRVVDLEGHLAAAPNVSR